MAKTPDLRAKTDDQLAGDLAELKREAFNLRFQAATNQLERPARIKEVRRDIARIMTVLKEKAPAGASTVAQGLSLELAERRDTLALASSAAGLLTWTWSPADDVMSVDEHMRITQFTEKPKHPDSIPGKPGTALVSMGIYIFSKDFLYKTLIADAGRSDSSHGRSPSPAPR